MAGGRFSRTASFNSRREEELGGVFAWAILIAYVLMLAQSASFGEAALLGSVSSLQRRLARLFPPRSD